MFKKLFLILVLCLLPSTVLGGKEEPTFNPCGLNGLQIDGLTFYFTRRFNAQYKDLSEEDTAYFLKAIEQENSRITNVRVFKSPNRKGYAVVSSYLFQNFLNGKVLVELYCVERLNGSPILYLIDEGIQKFIGKSYDELD